MHLTAAGLLMLTWSALWQDMGCNNTSPNNFVHIYGPKTGTGASGVYDVKGKDDWITWFIIGFILDFLGLLPRHISQG